MSVVKSNCCKSLVSDVKGDQNLAARNDGNGLLEGRLRTVIGQNTYGLRSTRTPGFRLERQNTAKVVDIPKQNGV